MTSEDTAVPVARTADPVSSAIWVDALRQEGIKAASVERGVGAALGGMSGVGQFVIIVRQSQVGAARSIIAELDGARALVPITTPGERDGAANRALLFAAGGIGTAIVAGLIVRFVI